MTSVDEFVNSSAWLIKVSGAQRGRERHAAPAADAHGGRIAARAQPPRPLTPHRPADAMDFADGPRHRPYAFDRMESLIKEMQDPETGVPVKCQKLFLSIIPSAFMGYDVVEWLMDRFNIDESNNIEALSLANHLCQHGYLFPVNDSKNLTIKDDSSLYRFQSPYYWPWQGPRVTGGGSSAQTQGPDNVEYAIYLVKRTLRNKQRHGLEDYEQEALANLKKNLAAKWDFITMQAEEQVRLAKDRKKGDKAVSDSQERAYWRVARPPPGVISALEPCPVPVRVRNPKPKKRSIRRLTREVEQLRASLDRTRVKTSVALEALVAYSETYAPYDPWLTPPQPSNPWISDDTLFWQINSPLVETPSDKRVQRWALSIDELVSDPTGLQEFTSFLRKEYSHENIRFWLAVRDLRRSSIKQISKKLEEIYEEFLKPGAPCEINIDGATADRVMEGLRSGSRYAFDHAADHVYGLLLKKDCYPRFVRSDHFQRLLAEGKTVYQKKAKFFNFGGQVKKKPSSTSTTGTGLSRRRGSDRSLTGSAHELTVCAVQPPRPSEPPPHSHSQSNLCDIPFRDPLDDDTADVLPWECPPREGVYTRGSRRRQDSAADSGSSSSDVSSAVVVAERTRRLPQQSTLDGGLRGAPPPLRRLSAVEPRHLTPLGSPPHTPRPPRPAPATATAANPAPPHPTPTISVSSAPDDESADSLPGYSSSEERRSGIPSEEPSSVFASADVTPTEANITNFKISDDRCAIANTKTIPLSTTSEDIISDDLNVDVKIVNESAGALSTESYDESTTSGADSKASDWSKSSEDIVASAPRTLSREPSTTKEISPASYKDISSNFGDIPETKTDKVDANNEVEPPCSVHAARKLGKNEEGLLVLDPMNAATLELTVHNARSSLAETPSDTCRTTVVTVAIETTSVRPPVAPLAVCEDIGADEDNIDKVPSVTSHLVSAECKAASESDAVKKIAHNDELSSVSESNIVKRENLGSSGERKQRNDICPWEDENSCESDAPFVKTYATLGYL